MKNNSLVSLKPQDFICMDDYAASHNFMMDIAYAKPDNLLFGERIYRTEAKLFLYKPLGNVFLKAAKALYDERGLTMIFYDGLRTTTAQQKMLETQVVKDNPQWLQEPRLLSPPGAGGHPRGMAVDYSILDKNGQLIDMGTEFDKMYESSDVSVNRAHRNYKGLSDEILSNRALHWAYPKRFADEMDVTIVGLNQEWWDVRMPADFINQYAPLCDDELPDFMKMCDEH